MRGVGGVGDVDGVDAAALLLRDALKDPLRTRALDANRDPWILGFKRLAELFGDIQLERGIVGDLALDRKSVV